MFDHRDRHSNFLINDPAKKEDFLVIWNDDFFYLSVRKDDQSYRCFVIMGGIEVSYF